MIVTIFTDASFDDRARAGGWSAWVKYGGAAATTLRFSAPFREKPCSSIGAELAAIANALHLAATRLPLTPDTFVILQTDCVPAIDLLEGRWRKQRAAFLAACERSINETVAKAGFRLELRHVRAHRHKVDRRSAVNEWCDTAAKSALRRARERQAASARSAELCRGGSCVR